MFVTNKRRGYDRSGSQVASGEFLCIFSDVKAPGDEHLKLYAVVRSCSMSQFGHFMMGFVKIGGQRLTVSGTYGSDGLPMDLDKLTPENQRKYLTAVPKDLQDKFWAGGGHNSAGSEGPDMFEFGKTLLLLKTKGTRP